MGTVILNGGQMKRAIVRVLWGQYDKSDRILRRKRRVDGNIVTLLKSPFNSEFVTYIYGKDNYNDLLDIGLENLILLDDKPHIFDSIKEQFRHKLEILKVAMQEYDEIVYLDFDAIPCKPFDGFWDSIDKSRPFQANLCQYRRIRAPWRNKIDVRKIPNCGAMYLGNKSVAMDLIKWWEDPRHTDKKSCEPSTALWLDDINGGWIGCDKWKELYEAKWVNLKMNGVFDNSSTAYFIHHAGLGSIME